MSLSITDIKYKTLVLNRHLDFPFCSPNTIIIAQYIISITDQGDASGGSVSCNIDYSTTQLSAEQNNPHYIITDILTYQSSGYNTTLITNTDRWLNTYVPGHNNINISFWSSEGLYYSFKHSDSIKHIMYLGSPHWSDSDPGLCTISWPTNTENDWYNAIILGYIIDRPLPYSSIHQ